MLPSPTKAPLSATPMQPPAPVQAPLPPSDESDDQFAQLRPGAVAGIESDDFSQLRPSHGPGVTTAFDPFSQ